MPVFQSFRGGQWMNRLRNSRQQTGRELTTDSRLADGNDFPLPYDILERITFFLSNDPRTLQSLALVCKSTVLPCQIKLFHSIDLIQPRYEDPSTEVFPGPNRPVKRLEKLLSKNNPTLASYMRHISIRVGVHRGLIRDAPILGEMTKWTSPYQPSDDLLRMLIDLPNLQHLNLSLYLWLSSPKEKELRKKTALLVHQLIASPSLKSICFEGPNSSENGRRSIPFPFLENLGRNVEELSLRDMWISDIPIYSRSSSPVEGEQQRSQPEQLQSQTSKIRPRIRILSLTGFARGVLHKLVKYAFHPQSSLDLSQLEEIRLDCNIAHEQDFRAVDRLLDSCSSTLRRISCTPLLLRSQTSYPGRHILDMNTLPSSTCLNIVIKSHTTLNLERNLTSLIRYFSHYNTPVALEGIRFQFDWLEWRELSSPRLYSQVEWETLSKVLMGSSFRSLRWVSFVYLWGPRFSEGLTKEGVQEMAHICRRTLQKRVAHLQGKGTIEIVNPLEETSSA